MLFKGRCYDLPFLHSMAAWISSTFDLESFLSTQYTVVCKDFTAEQTDETSAFLFNYTTPWLLEL